MCAQCMVCLRITQVRQSLACLKQKKPCQLQVVRSLASGSEQLRESISAGLNWMDGEPKEGPDLVPSLQVLFCSLAPRPGFCAVDHAQ